MVFDEKNCSEPAAAVVDEDAASRLAVVTVAVIVGLTDCGLSVVINPAGRVCSVEVVVFTGNTSLAVTFSVGVRSLKLLVAGSAVVNSSRPPAELLDFFLIPSSGTVVGNTFCPAVISAGFVGCEVAGFNTLLCAVTCWVVVTSVGAVMFVLLLSGAELVTGSSANRMLTHTPHSSRVHIMLDGFIVAYRI